MGMKKLGVALVIVLALGVVVASSASAAAVAESATWRTGSAGTVLSGSETETSTGSTELVTSVGETPLVLKSTGLECLECTIKNEEGRASGTGKLRLTGVTVASPAACAVNGGSITTTVIVFAHYYMNGSLWFTHITIFSGANLATVTLVKGSGACSIAGTYNLTGNLFTRATNATGVYAATQSATSSGAINKEGGGELKFGSKAAELNGCSTFALSGPRKGEVFGVHQ